MSDLKIIGWSDFDSVYPTRKYNNEELGIILGLIQVDIRKNGYVFSGEEHQRSFTGVPVFSDGTCFRASMRCWGHIMATIYCGPNGEELSYMDFYTSLGDSSVLPEYFDIDVIPAKLEEESFGCTVQADRNIINESLDLGMQFMTTDKVLQKLYEQMSESRKN